MSKERAKRRAERESAVANRQLAQQAERERLAARDRRRRLVSLPGADRRARSRGRLRSGNSARVRERRAAIASTLLVVLVLTYLMTRSIGMVIGVGLIAAIATPAIAAAFGDRSKK